MAGDAIRIMDKLGLEYDRFLQRDVLGACQQSIPRCMDDRLFIARQSRRDAFDILLPCGKGDAG